MERIDIVLLVLNILFCGLLFFMAGYVERVINSKWRILWCVPVIVCLIVVVISGFEALMLGAYIAPVLLLSGFFNEKRKHRRLTSIASAVITLVSLPLCLTGAGYRAPDYVKEFKECFKLMEEHYILAEHKGIDWDKLYEEYLPKFESADKNHDEIENYIAWIELCAEFNDGHVCYVPAKNYEDKLVKALDRVLGNDYGLALMSLSDGRVAAVNVEVGGEAEKAGIRNGTIITGWDGKNPAELGEGLTEYAFTAFADKDNEEFYRVLFGAGTGGDTVSVSFLDESGAEKTAVLPKNGAYYSGRMEGALEIIDQGLEMGHLTWQKLDEKTVALRVKMMMDDFKSASTGDFESFKSRISNTLYAFKEEGVENIVIDLRGNGGGSGYMVMAMASLFAPEGEHYYATDGLWNDELGSYVTDPETGKYLEGEKNYFTGENILGEGKIIILVNSSAISAADHLVKVLQGFENITVMGFTEPNGSAQGVVGIETENGALSFSNSLLLDENGDIFIDSDTSMESGDDVDIKIAFDETAVKALFEDGEDYVLQKALEYLNAE